MENQPNNPHMWMPNIFRLLPDADPAEQSCGELCNLCGVFRNGATPDPPEAARL